MNFFQKITQPVLLFFPGLELNTSATLFTYRLQQITGNTNTLRNNAMFFLGLLLLFLSGCTAQQVGQIIDKIPDASGSQSNVESTGQNESGYADTQQAAPKIIYFKADPPFVMDGSSTTLQWRTDDVTSTQILGIGTVSATGSREITPENQTRFELVATNSLGQSIRDEIIIPKAVPMRGEAPEGFKIRAVKRFNVLNPKKTISLSPQSLRKIKLKAFKPVVVGTYTPRPRPRPNVVDHRRPIPRPAKPTCASHVQGKIAWNYNNSKRWAANNIKRLCKGAEQSPEPARCFNRVMHGGINWGSSTKWKWSNAIDLCEGSTNANGTIGCFKRNISHGRSWKQAIKSCSK